LVFDVRVEPIDRSLFAGTPEGAAALRSLAAVAASVAAYRDRPWTGSVGVELEVCPAEGVGPRQALLDLGDAVVRHGVQVAHPHTAAHLQTPPLAVAAATELVIGATNQSMDSFDQAPAATYAEDRLVRWLAREAGLPGSASGVMTAGGTASNLLGLLLARDRAAQAAGVDPRRNALPPAASGWRIVASSAAHFSVRRAAALFGLGGDAVVPVACSSDGSMSVPALDEVLADLRARGLSAIAIVATAGTTDLGAIDPIYALAERARSCGAWLHVDAAVGGSLLLSDALRARLAGIDAADSITLDLHKLLWQPIGASALLVRDGEAFAAVREPSDYLDREEDADDGVLNLVGRSLDTSRRFDALKVLVSLRALGRRQLGEMVERLLWLTRWAADAVRARPALTLIAEPQTVTVVFRVGVGVDGSGAPDEVAVAVQRGLLASGRAIIGRTRIDGAAALKLTLMNPSLSVEDVEALVELVALEAERVAGTSGR
jgi:L-2,4-diaminobutyrate decarboxylase